MQPVNTQCIAGLPSTSCSAHAIHAGRELTHGASRLPAGRAWQGAARRQWGTRASARRRRRVQSSVALSLQRLRHRTFFYLRQIRLVYKGDERRCRATMRPNPRRAAPRPSSASAARAGRPTRCLIGHAPSPCVIAMVIGCGGDEMLMRGAAGQGEDERLRVTVRAKTSAPVSGQSASTAPSRCNHASRPVNVDTVAPNYCER